MRVQPAHVGCCGGLLAAFAAKSAAAVECGQTVHTHGFSIQAEGADEAARLLIVKGRVDGVCAIRGGGQRVMCRVKHLERWHQCLEFDIEARPAPIVVAEVTGGARRSAAYEQPV